MKKALSVCIVLLLSFVSCGEPDEFILKSTFEAPFPKRNKDLASILGEKLTLWNGTDTLRYRITSTAKTNLVTDAGTGDTLFSGTVCRFRGLYYFSQQLNDSSYWIFAVKIQDSLIYGLSDPYRQMQAVDKKIRSGASPAIVKYIDTGKNMIRLKTDKKELQHLYTSVLENMNPDVILSYATPPPKAQKPKATAAGETDEFELLSNLYPNPTSDHLTVELQLNHRVDYSLTDMYGRTVLQGRFTEMRNQTDLSKLKDGIYVMTLSNPSDRHIETIRVVKRK
jgi:hypothetical protein